MEKDRQSFESATLAQITRDARKSDELARVTKTCNPQNIVCYCIIYILKMYTENF
jgi:hypothetical protein